MAGTVSMSTPQQAPKGSGFTNLANYLRANQGNQLANVVGAGVGSAANRVSSNLATDLGNFNTQSSSAENDPSNEMNLQARTNVLNQIASGTPDVSDADAVKFQRLAAGQYTGPMGLSSADTLKSQAQGVQQLGKALSSSGGKQGLLQQFVGGPQYTQGERTADSLLLGQSPQLTKARQKAMAVVPQIGNAVQTTAAQGMQKQAQAKQTGTETNQALQSTTQQIVNPLEQRYNDWVAQQQQAQQNLTEGALTPEQLASMGLTAGTLTYGVDPTNSMFFNTPSLSLGGVATPQQQAQIAALSKLAGQNPTQYVPGYDPVAGQNPVAGPYSFQTKAFQDAIGQKKAQLDQEAQQQNVASPSIIPMQEAGHGAHVKVKGQPDPYMNMYEYADKLGSMFKSPEPYANLSLGTAQAAVKQGTDTLNEVLPQIYADAYNVPLDFAKGKVGEPGFDINSILNGPARSTDWKQSLVAALGRFRDNVNNLKTSADKTSQDFWSKYNQQIKQKA